MYLAAVYLVKVHGLHSTPLHSEEVALSRVWRLDCPCQSLDPYPGAPGPQNGCRGRVHRRELHAGLGRCEPGRSYWQCGTRSCWTRPAIHAVPTAPGAAPSMSITSSSTSATTRSPWIVSGKPTAIQHDPVSRARYAVLRARGHRHARALRAMLRWRRIQERTVPSGCACSRRRWHARRPIASVRSPQQPPKCVKIRCLYRRPMQLLEALQVAADGLQVGG